MRYIQDTKEWKQAEKKAALVFAVDACQCTDEALIESLGGRPSEKAKPPKGAGVTLSTT